MRLSHLENLESESIHVFREVISEAKNPVMLYSLGKDSCVMLHLAKKAFYPQKIPFPLLHVDTGWKFQEMYKFRDEVVSKDNFELIKYKNLEGEKLKINPFDSGSEKHTLIMKTDALKKALTHYKFDVAFGGARRDEEKSRSKEKIFSFRSDNFKWDPKNQRPELWNIYNSKLNVNETLRVFPLSNWTELDIWLYIFKEKIDIVPLYFAKKRKVINRNNMLIMLDDDRVKVKKNETEINKTVRFRTLGCYPLTGAVISNANSVEKIIEELISSKYSERQGRAIDKDEGASMEQKKIDGYF